jgi:hypothetical protein
VSEQLTPITVRLDLMVDHSLSINLFKINQKRDRTSEKFVEANNQPQQQVVAS